MTTVQPPGAARRVPWQRLLQLALSAALVGWLLSRVDAATLVAARALSVETVLAALLLLASSQVWGAMRLWLLLRRQGSEIRCGDTILLTWVGLFAGNFLPSTIGGDIAKGVLLSRRGVAGKVAVAALVMDRLVNVTTVVAITISCMIAAGLWGLVPKIVWGAGPAPGASSARVSASLQHHAPDGNGCFRRVSREYARIARLWLAWPSGLMLAVLLSALSVMSAVVGLFLLLRDLGGGMSLVTFTAVIGLVYVVTLVPVSFNGIGVQEVALVLFLTALGIAGDQATVLAVTARLLMLAVTLPGAFAVPGRLR